jgi:hypothetical protein
LNVWRSRKSNPDGDPAHGYHLKDSLKCIADVDALAFSKTYVKLLRMQWDGWETDTGWLDPLELDNSADEHEIFEQG